MFGLGGRNSLFLRILDFILSRSDDELAELSVKSLASEFNVSRRVLEYEFEKGAIRTAEYIDRCRLYRAAKLLKSRPDLKIEEIACRLGFSSCKHFRRCFKTFFRVLPRQYRIPR